MTYTTLTHNGTEMNLADWGISTWSRNVQNQGADDFTFNVITPMDGAPQFPYAANVIIRVNRQANRANPANPTAPASANDGGGALTYSGGTQWFWGYCIDLNRVGEPDNEMFQYKFVGPFEFFFGRLIFQKLQLSWYGADQVQIADWQSDVVLGLSLTTVVQGNPAGVTTATNLMTIAQQVKEICMYAQNDSVYQQANNGLGWPATAIGGQPANAQFQCDSLTTAVDGVNYDLLATPSANVLIQDYCEGPVSGKTSASALPAGSFMLRPPLDAVNAITCKEALQRVLQWLGGIGSPVIWTDHSQSPPQLRVAVRGELSTADPGNTTTQQRMTGGYSLNLPLTGITVKNKIKRRTDLIPNAVHFKYKVSGSLFGQPYNLVVNDLAFYENGNLIELVGYIGLPVGGYASLTPLLGGTVSPTLQTIAIAACKTATAIVQTLDFQGDKINAASCKIATASIAGALGSAADSAWLQMFPELRNVNGLQFYDASTLSITSPDGTQTYYSGGAWTGTNYTNWVTDGQVAPWMNASGGTAANPNPGQTVKAKISVRFSYQEKILGTGTSYATGANKSYQEKSFTCTLTTLASGTYYSAPQITSLGEPIPYGLAGYILALENIAQYEGSILVQEREISDVCPIGNTLNITGGLTEWATMAACVQSVRYSDNGQTEITIGPARHLGPAQFVQRFRNNIGPRWYLQIGGDPMNASNPGNGALGNNIPGAGATDGGVNHSFDQMLASVSGQQGSSGNVATLAAGHFWDTGAGGAPVGFATGSIVSGQRGFVTNQPQHVLAAGPNGSTPGESNAWVRMSLADLLNPSNGFSVATPGGSQPPVLYFREVQAQETISGVCTPGFRLVLCSQFYSTSIRSTPDP